MRCPMLLIWMLLAACAHREVRCDVHLQPINRPAPIPHPADEPRSTPP